MENDSGGSLLTLKDANSDAPREMFDDPAYKAALAKHSKNMGYKDDPQNVDRFVRAHNAATAEYLQSKAAQATRKLYPSASDHDGDE